MKQIALISHVLGLSAIMLLGCGGAESYGGIDTDVASRQSPQGLLGAGVGLDDDNTVENGIKLNGIKLNGIKLNGIKLNGIKLNGIKLNGIKLNGSVLCADGINGDKQCGAMLEGGYLTAQKPNGQELEVRIDRVEADASGEFSWYTITYPKGGDWISVCGIGDNGLPLRAIALEGRWDMSEGTPTGGDFIPNPLMFTLACEGFVLSKCVSLTGYYPWENVTEVNAAGDLQVLSRRFLHQSCTRMLRADYCGDGQPHTQDGVLINSWDAFGLDPSEPQPGMTLEAEWSEGGAQCLKHVRHAGQGVGVAHSSANYIQNHCPWITAPAIEQACGTGQSTFYTEAGFHVPAEERTWLMNASAE